jgi:hypothetical protein
MRLAASNNDKMQGYTTITADNTVRSVDGEPRTFEFFDMKSGERETITINGKTGKKTSKPKRSPKKPEQEIEEEVKAFLEPHKEVEQMETKTIKVITDITESEIDVIHAETNDECICIFMDSNSKVKLKPKKGAIITIEIDGYQVEAYSPGVYITIDKLNMDMVFLLVYGGNEE